MHPNQAPVEISYIVKIKYAVLKDLVHYVS